MCRSSLYHFAPIIVTLYLPLTLCLHMPKIPVYHAIGLCVVTLKFIKLNWLSVRLLTCKGQDLEVPHTTQMLQSEISNLGTPTEEQGRQRQHGRYVAHADVSNMDTPGEETNTSGRG
jgi:hypothetical protein